MDLFILDDERLLLREALAAFLSARGIEVRLATGDPDELVAALVAAAGVQPPRAAIIELLPRGFEVLERLRREAPATAVIVLTSSTDPVQARRALELGAAACVEKHLLAAAQLVPLLERAVAGERVVALEPLPSASRAAVPRVDDALTAREREVLRHLAMGADNAKIAAELGITERTVRAHVSALYRKLDAENRTQLALAGRRLGTWLRDSA